MFFPWGTYLVSAPIVANAQTLLGVLAWQSTKGSIIKAAPGFVGDMVIVSSNNSVNISHINIDATGVPYGLHCTKVNNAMSSINRVTVQYATTACFYFKECQVSHMAGLRALNGLGDGFFISGCNAAVFLSCSAALNIGSGFVVTGGAPTFSGGCTLTECHSEANENHGIELRAETLGTASPLVLPRVLNCWIEGNFMHGVYLLEVSAAIISGNRITSRHYGAGSGGVNIHGLKVEDSNIVVVLNNYVTVSVGAHADFKTIKSENSSSTSISNNWTLTNLQDAPLLHSPANEFIVTGLLTSANVWAAAQSVTPNTLTHGANIATDAALSNVFDVTLSGATAQLDNPTNLADGQTIRWRVAQDGTGGRALTFGTNFDWGSDAAPDLTTEAAGALTIITGTSDGTKVLVTAKLGYTT